MTPLPHRYDVELTGTPAGCIASSAGVPDMAVAPPTQYDGPGDAWSPEQMLLSAVAACFVFTFRAVARATHTPFVSIDVTAAGTVARPMKTVRFVEIVLHPRIAVPAGTDHARVLATVDQSEARCLIAASLSCPVRVEANIVEAASEPLADTPAPVAA